MDITIATWFVADTANNATYFPQVGGDSSSSSFQRIYWRCVVSFFATSIIQNPGATHKFYTNCSPPAFDGFDVGAFLAEHRIEIVPLEISYRLPRDVASAWGNQFYILDIIKHFAAAPNTSRLLVLDSDCVWNSGAEMLSEAMDRFGCLTYTIDGYPLSRGINGVTQAQMKEALLRWSPGFSLPTPEFGLYYHGGEIFAATAKEVEQIVSKIDSLWRWQVHNPQQRGFLEEAHFLSILYALNGYQPYTANRFIKRMWTNFKYRNIAANDRELTIWHLPAEKRSGFETLFNEIRHDRLPTDRRLLGAKLSRIMGVPHRTPDKFLRDLSSKVAEAIRGTRATK